MSKKRVFLSLKQKADIIDKLDKGQAPINLAKEYGVAKSTISGINKNKENIVKSATKSGSKNRKTTRSGEYPALERALHKWVTKQRMKNLPISGQMLKAKASQLFQRSGGCSSDFHASNGWLDSFKSRYGIRLLKICGEKVSCNHEAVPDFKQKLHSIRQEFNLNEQQVYNADESSLFWKMLPDKTFVTSNEKTAPGRKLEKARITFMACTNASGEHKLTPLMIGPAKNPRAFKNFNNPVEYRSSKKAWMNASIFTDWFHSIFVPQVQKFLKQKALPQKAVLLLDNAPCHPQNLTSADGSIFVIFMPPNVTPLIQPMDQNVIRLTKLSYRKNLLSSAVGHKDIALFLKNLNLKHAAHFLSIAWNQIKAETIKKCWRPLFEDPPSCSFEAEYEIPLKALRQQILEERNAEIDHIQDILELVVPERIFSTEELLQWNRTEENEPFGAVISESDEESEEDFDVVQPNAITSAEAVTVFNKAIEWAEVNTTDTSNIQVLMEFRDKAIQKCVTGSKKQSKINEFFPHA